MRPGQPKPYHNATKLGGACLRTWARPAAAPTTATWQERVMSRVHRSIPARSFLRAWGTQGTPSAHPARMRRAGGGPLASPGHAAMDHVIVCAPAPQSLAPMAPSSWQQPASPSTSFTGTLLLAWAASLVQRACGQSLLACAQQAPANAKRPAAACTRCLATPLLVPHRPIPKRGP